MELSLALAFTAGLVSFVTPCVLALVPVYVAFLAEAAASAPLPAGSPISGGAAGQAPGTEAASGAVLLQAALFTVGFSAVFVLLGLSAGLVGAALFRDPLVRQVAGAAIIVIGVLMTGAFGPVLDRIPGPPAAGRPPAGRYSRAVGLGALVGVGWTPCIGPVLGAILVLGASAQDVGAATLLLTAYAVGLALPFLAAAAFLPRIHPALRWLRAHGRPIRVAAGLAVVGIGLLVFFDAFTRLAELFGEFFL
jgi:cytochrome c-type biogenesis protein